MDQLPLLIAATLASGTPLALAGLGLLINEKAGVLNLGAEGMMLVAAIAGFAAAFTTGSDTLAFVAGAAAGGLLAAAFGALVIWLNTNQYATGLAVSLFGYGFSAFVGVGYVGQKLSERTPFEMPGLSQIPFIGPALFRHHPMVYIAIALIAATVWFLYRSRAGLVLRAVGESPESAHALGYKVRWIRLLAVVAGGALCGVAGAFLSVVYAPLWVEGLGGRPRLDRAGADHLRHLAAGARAARCLPVRRRDDGAVCAAGRGRQLLQPAAGDAALHRHHRGAGHHQPQPHLDPHQHAGLAGEALPPRHIIVVLVGADRAGGRSTRWSDGSTHPQTGDSPHEHPIQTQPAGLDGRRRRWPRWSAAARRKSPRRRLRRRPPRRRLPPHPRPLPSR